MVHDPRGVSRRVTLDNRLAPELLIEFKCPKCGFYVELDVYLGPPSCLGDKEDPHVIRFMIPLHLARDYEEDPTYG